MVVVLPGPFVEAVDRAGLTGRALAARADTGRSTTAALVAQARATVNGDGADQIARTHYDTAVALAAALGEPVGRLFVADPNPLAS